MPSGGLASSQHALGGNFDIIMRDVPLAKSSAEAIGPEREIERRRETEREKRDLNY